MGKIKVSVTNDDIRDGTGGDCYHCAVALAVLRAVKPVVHGAARVEVDPSSNGISVMRIDFSSLVVIPMSEVPESVEHFISEFDEWYDCDPDWGVEYPSPKPFEFELELD